MRSGVQAKTLSGGQLVVRTLLEGGADLGFCVPGESYLPVLDALRDVEDDFDLVTCRHEATAAHMAEAAGKLTGRPAVCLVTRGPGAMQAAVGVHTAAQDSTPMLLLVGQVPTTARGREVFQEVDYEAVFGTVAKWVVEITDARRVPELVSRAQRTAVAGRPGPVVVALPEDVLWAQVEPNAWAGAVPRAATPPPGDVDDLRSLLATARRPLVVVGGPAWTPAAKARLEQVAGATGLAVATAFRRQDHFDNRHARYVGNLGIPWNSRLAERVAASDVVLALGTRLDSMTTRDGTLLSPEHAAASLVHVHPDAAVLGAASPVRLPIAAAAAQFVDRLAELVPPGPNPDWVAWADAGRAEQECWVAAGAGADADRVDLAEVVRTVRRLTPDDTVFCNGAGNYTGWLHRYMEYRDMHTQAAPLSGSMGYGVPAAIAACLARPGGRAVAFAGDGCFQMAAHELATAVARGLAPVVVLVNNQMLGTIRMHQDRHYPGRAYATSLANPDFVALARAHGAHAEQVTSTDEFEPAFRRALDCGRAALVEVRVGSDRPRTPPPWPAEASA